jgi:hypothetical protein
MGVLHGEVGSCRERYETSYLNGSAVTCVKLKEFKEENLDPLSSPLIKADPEVSFMSVCFALVCFIDVQNGMSVCPSVLMNQLFHCGKWVLGTLHDSVTRKFYL